MTFRLQPAQESDREFLFALHCATMGIYIDRTWGWDEAWQRIYFDEHFDPSTQQIIVVDGERVGVLEFETKRREIFIANIQILPAMQSRGIGTAVMRHVMAESAQSGLGTALQVLAANERARRLYERLGFRVVGENPPHIVMRA